VLNKLINALQYLRRINLRFAGILMDFNQICVQSSLYSIVGRPIQMKSYSYAVILFLFWIFLSGHLTPLLLGLGVASVVLTFFLSRRMNVIDNESYPLHLSSKLPGFYVYLLKEIIKSNIDVAKRIVKWKGPFVSPQLIEIPQSQKTDLGAVIYANSITLTPGTVTIKLSKDHLTVHALSKDAADELVTGDMSKEISKRVFRQ